MWTEKILLSYPYTQLTTYILYALFVNHKVPTRVYNVAWYVIYQLSAYEQRINIVMLKLYSLSKHKIKKRFIYK